MTEQQIKSELRDSLSKDQMESLDLRARVPRSTFVKIYRAMLFYGIKDIPHLITNWAIADEQRRAALQNTTPPPAVEVKSPTRARSDSLH